MVYIRKKTIYGNDYWYLCESKRKDGVVKQEVVSYLGSCKNISVQEVEEMRRKYLDSLEDG